MAIFGLIKTKKSRKRKGLPPEYYEDQSYFLKKEKEGQPEFGATDFHGKAVHSLVDKPVSFLRKQLDNKYVKVNASRRSKSYRGMGMDNVPNNIFDALSATSGSEWKRQSSMDKRRFLGDDESLGGRRYSVVVENDGKKFTVYDNKKDVKVKDFNNMDRAADYCYHLNWEEERKGGEGSFKTRLKNVLWGAFAMSIPVVIHGTIEWFKKGRDRQEKLKDMDSELEWSRRNKLPYRGIMPRGDD